MNRIAAPHLSRRRVFLICVVIGIFASRSFQGLPEPGGSLFVVHIAPPEDVYGHRFDPAAGRDMTNYERLGPVEECSWQDGGELRRCLRAREQARRLIYDSWQLKRRAYVTIDFPCADCGPTLHAFVEPNEAGSWRIALVMEESRFPPRHWPDAFGVAYRKADANERVRERTSLLLSLRDASGREIDAF